MTHKISDSGFSAAISEMGAELKSFKNINRGIEYIWEGKPEFWTGTAPVLFPIVGMLKDDEYFYEGKKYSMSKHGFARKSSFELVDKAENRVLFRLKSNKLTKKMYPFDFELIISFSIEGQRLKIVNTVKNTSSGNIYFSLGVHPAFSLPLGTKSLSDYYIEFNKNEKLQLCTLRDGLLETKTEEFRLSEGNRIYLSSSIFDKDALIFKNINSRKFTLSCNPGDYKLGMYNSGNAPHLGIWAKPNAPYVCIEPWHGHADFVDTDKDFIKKDSIISLNKDEEFVSGYELEV
jgi:galactose mutarotase-like enzyme